MRLFIALDVPQETIEDLAETSAELRECVKGRALPPASFHVTLAFLGEVDSARIDEIAAALDRVCARYEAIETRLGSFGSFGRRKDAQLWQGFEDPEPIVALAIELREELDALGIDYDRKPVRPHITLMRRANLESGILPMPCRSSVRIATASLFSSKLTPEGAIYHPLHTSPLL